MGRPTQEPWPRRHPFLALLIIAALVVGGWYAGWRIFVWMVHVAMRTG